MSLLDLIFPKYCVNCKKYGDFVCSDCFSRISFDTKNICLDCGNPSYDGLTHPKCMGRYTIEGSFTGVVYNSISKKLLFQFKYNPYLSGLGRFITELLYESLIQNEEFEKILKQVQDDIVLVPIPISHNRLRNRGYNQSEILAKNLAKKLTLPAENLLIRARDTKSQFSLTREERKENMKGAFSLKDLSVKGKNIFLIDDVLTTGTTLSEAAKVLKKAEAKRVWGVAFAREQ